MAFLTSESGVVPLASACHYSFWCLSVTKACCSISAYLEPEYEGTLLIETLWILKTKIALVQGPLLSLRQAIRQQ